MAKGTDTTLRKPFRRVDPFPIDISCIFTSLDDAVKYVRRDNTDSRRIGGSAYLGQIISVVEEDASANTVVQVYKIISLGKDEYEEDILGLSLIAEGTSENVFISETIQIGDVEIHEGDSLTQALQTISNVINEKDDGVLTDDIVVNGEVIVSSGETVTNALSAVTEFLYTKITEITPETLYVADDIFLHGEVVIPSGSSISEALEILSEEVGKKGEGIISEDVVIDGIRYSAGTDVTIVISAIAYALSGVSDGSITEDIIINNVVYSAGTPVTEVISAISDAITEKYDGIISDDITYSGETIVPSGTTITEAIQAIVDAFFSGSEEIPIIVDARLNNNSIVNEDGVASLNVVDSEEIKVNIRNKNILSFDIIKIENGQIEI